jgi:hypothetical protein
MMGILFLFFEAYFGAVCLCIGENKQIRRIYNIAYGRNATNPK